MEAVKKIHPFEIEVLACKITNLDYDEIDADNAIIDEALMDKFGCCFDQFCDIINRLAPLIAVSKSELTEKTYKGFADIENGIWLSKIEA